MVCKYISCESSMDTLFSVSMYADTRTRVLHAMCLAIVYVRFSKFYCVYLAHAPLQYQFSFEDQVHLLPFRSSRSRSHTSLSRNGRSSTHQVPKFKQTSSRSSTNTSSEDTCTSGTSSPMRNGIKFQASGRSVYVITRLGQQRTKSLKRPVTSCYSAWEAYIGGTGPTYLDWKSSEGSYFTAHNSTRTRIL